MALMLYNTATRTKEEFRPLHPGKVGIYVCGVTVYDLCHIGHARSAIVFDVLVRYLRARGFQVTYIRNFTDVDDKIIDRAGQLGRTAEALAEENIQAFSEDMERLGVMNADVEPRATRHIGEMIAMITTLLSKGMAYAEAGDVFFSVEKWSDYGRLSARRIEDMRAGSRIAVDDKKRHPMDFALWKAAKPGEPQWPSPWGPGRPGWHIECSAMSSRYLGPTFDIHGGGLDLLFPHHENERAQSMAANDAPFARYWVHNGFVTVESEKMSKSLGNFLSIRDALQIYHPEVLRLFLLSKHYRSPIDFSRRAVLDLQSGLVRIYRTVARLKETIGEYDGSREAPVDGSLSGDELTGFRGQFIDAMDDDLNTSAAIALFFEKIKEMNKTMDSGAGRLNDPEKERLRQDGRDLLLAARVLGLLSENPEGFFKKISSAAESLPEEEIRQMIEERTRARANKDWAAADAVRERLHGLGIVLEDGPKGTTWRYDV